MFCSNDLHQKQVGLFLRMLKKELRTPEDFVNKREQIFREGQEMGLCNEEIDDVLEDYMEMSKEE